MEKRYKILIFVIILILLFLIVFSFAEQYVYSKKQTRITHIESQYGANENVIISGLASPNSQVTIILNNEIGSIVSDKKGGWTVNLGVLPAGKHAFQVVCDDSENSKSIATASINISSSQINRQSASILDGLKKDPEKIVTVPLSTPQVLDGSWQLVK